MNNSTADKILEYLQDHPPSSSNEISSALLLTKADIRYHLKNMLKVGIVSRRTKRLEFGAGRPGYLYTTSRADPNSGYTLLAGICANVLLKEPANRLKSQHDIANGLADGFHDHNSIGSERLGMVVQYLTELGYQSIWEARSDHPIIYFRNCPYLDLAVNQPELCQVDLVLIEKITGWKCEQTRRIRDDFSQISTCRFSLINQQ
jgi:DeoR family transcriptional regulator, suf operon transcriptional repressor